MRDKSRLRDKREVLSDTTSSYPSVDPVGFYRWTIVGLLWLVCFFSYADRQALFSIFPLLQKSMHLDSVRLGMLGSSFAVVYGLAGPFAGFVVDHIRRKTAIIGGLQAWSVVCMLSALAGTFPQLIAFRAAEGLGESIYYPAALSMIGDYHGRLTRSRAMGILQTSVYLGTIGGGFCAGIIAQEYGWRASVFLFGAFGSALGLVLPGVMREPARGSADAIPVRSGPRLTAAVTGALIRNRSLIALTGAFACANFVALVLLAWMPIFLYSRFHLSLGVAAFDAAAYPQLASMAGSLCGGYTADKLIRRTRNGRVWVQCVGVLAGVPFVVLSGTSGSLTLVKCALAGWGFFKGVYDSNIFASAFDVVPVELRGTASGLMNCLGWLVGGGAAPILVGYVARSMALGSAIALSSSVYVIAGLLLIATARLWLRTDSTARLPA